MKKLSLVALFVVLMLTLTACWPGQTKSTMNITSEKGKGSKTITFTILKDGVDKPDGSGKVDNAKYFPKGIGPVTTWIVANAPAGFTVQHTEKSDRHEYTITYTFEDINEYNTKTKALIGNTHWAEYKLSDATITAAQKDGGYDVTFTENGKMLEASVIWAIKGIYAQPELFNPDGLKYNEIFEVNTLDVKIGSKNTSFNIKDSKPATITAAGTVTPTTSTETPTPATNNPATGDNIIGYVVLGLAALGGMIVMMTRKKRLN